MIKVIDDALSDEMFDKYFYFLNPENTVFDLYNEKIQWSISRNKSCVTVNISDASHALLGKRTV